MAHFQFSQVLFFCFLLTLPPPSIRAASIQRSNFNFDHVADLFNKGVIVLDKYVLDMISFKKKHEGNLHKNEAETDYSRIVNDAKKVHDRMSEAESYLKKEQNKVQDNIQVLIVEEKKLKDKIQAKKLEEQKSKNDIQTEQTKVNLIEEGIDQIEDSIARDKRKIKEIKDKGVQCDYDEWKSIGVSLGASLLCGFLECSDKTIDKIEGAIDSADEKLQERCKEAQESKSEWENKLETEIHSRREQERKRDAEQNILRNVQQQLQHQMQEERELQDNLKKDKQLHTSMADLLYRISDILSRSNDLFVNGELIYEQTAKQTEDLESQMWDTKYVNLDTLIVFLIEFVKNLKKAAEYQDQQSNIFSQRATQVISTCEKLLRDIEKLRVPKLKEPNCPPYEKYCS